MMPSRAHLLRRSPRWVSALSRAAVAIFLVVAATSGSVGVSQAAAMTRALSPNYMYDVTPTSRADALRAGEPGSAFRYGGAAERATGWVEHDADTGGISRVVGPLSPQSPAGAFAESAEIQATRRAGGLQGCCPPALKVV